MGAQFIYQHHHKTNSKVEHVNSVIADVLRSIAGKRANDWQALVQLVKFAIYYLPSPLGFGYRPFFSMCWRCCRTGRT